ncbi:MAG TPA: hypothetical protein VF607_10765, partial [Verrucomicrobiae bacterium]
MVYITTGGRTVVIPPNPAQGSRLDSSATLVLTSNAWARVKELQLQVRPYRWVEFHDVALQPRVPALPRIVDNTETKLEEVDHRRHFGPTFERTLLSDYRTQYGLDAETGEISSTLINETNVFSAHEYNDRIDEFLADHQCDFVAFVDGGDLHHCYLAGIRGTYGVALRDKSWDTLTELDVLTAADPLPSPANPLTGTPDFLKYSTLDWSVNRGQADTYAFRTGDGNVGMVQLLGDTDDPRGVRLRFKMILPLASPMETAEVAPELVYGPTVERELSFDDSADFLNLETGEVFRHDLASTSALRSDVHGPLMDWIQSHGVHLGFAQAEESNGVTLAVFNLGRRPLPSAKEIQKYRTAYGDIHLMTNSWDDFPPTRFMLHWNQVFFQNKLPVVLYSLNPTNNQLEDPIFFATEKGNLGLLQVASINTETHRLKLRYKMVHPGPLAMRFSKWHENNPVEAGFGPIQMRALPVSQGKQVWGTSLTGRNWNMQDAPSNLTGEVFFKTKHVDLLSAGDALPASYWSLNGINGMFAWPVANEDWDDMTSAEVAAHAMNLPDLDNPVKNTPEFLQATTMLGNTNATPRLTYVFHTGEGKSGLLQITGRHEDGARYFTFRYKFVLPTTTTTNGPGARASGQ